MISEILFTQLKTSHIKQEVNEYKKCDLHQNLYK